MNGDQLTPVVRRWLRHTEATPPDAHRSARQVMARMPYVRQRGRRWPLPIFGRRTSPAPFTSDREQRFAAIPDTLYRIPTATGRTRLMFSPVKAVVVGALVFALGGAFLIVQPFGQQNGVPGAEQGAEPVAPLRVTGPTISRKCGPESEPVVEGPVERWYGSGCEILKDWSDPRLAGVDWRNSNGTLYDLAGGDTLGVYYDVHVITTDEGAWRSRPQITFDFPGVPDISDFPKWWVLDGEGAHEGLSLLLFSAPNETLSGYIVSTDLLPPAPELDPPQ